MVDVTSYTKHHKKQARPQKRQLSGEERRALTILRQEARKAKAQLASDGEGGLAPSLVLYVMRRDGYRCKLHGDRGEGENGGLEVHHKGGVENPASRWLRGMGHLNLPDNLVTLCHRAHDEVHDRDREVTAERAQGDD
jgi:hypothetical protein